MPRVARTDAPGAVHHVMLRGLERRDIFLDDDDRREVLNRLSRLRPEWGGTCFAWVFMTNHIHLVLRTASLPLAWLMRRLNTGFARQFNDRHERVGYLFQDRYKSRLVVDDHDLMNLIRYVHLNPCRGMGVSLPEYRWSGHAALIGTRAPYPFENVRSTLALFDDDPGLARLRIAEWMQVAGPETSLPTRISDEETLEHPPWIEAGSGSTPKAGSLDELIDSACQRFGVRRQELERGARYERVVLARSWIAFVAVAEWRLPGVRIAPRVGVSPQAVSRAVLRGASLVESSRSPREET